MNNTLKEGKPLEAGEKNGGGGEGTNISAVPYKRYHDGGTEGSQNLRSWEKKRRDLCNCMLSIVNNTLKEGKPLEAGEKNGGSDQHFSCHGQTLP